MSVASVLNIAKNALALQRNALDVTGNNIANVNSQGYSRQKITATPGDSVFRNGLHFGTGVKAREIERVVDDFVNRSLVSHNSLFSGAEKQAVYARMLEGYFSEDGETGITNLLDGLWEAFGDLAANPAGSSERSALVEKSSALTSRLNQLSDLLVEMKNELTGSIKDGVEEINRLAANIAGINVKMLESSGRSAELADRLDQALIELSGYMDIRQQRNEDGTVSVTGPMGVLLADRSGSYDLKMGEDGSSLLWEGSGGRRVDITDRIEAGRIGGYLHMRDEVIEKIRLDLDEFSKVLIWNVNSVHAEGVGLRLFTSATPVTGTYKAESKLSDLFFHDKVSYGSRGFGLLVEDRTDSENPVKNSVLIDLSGIDPETDTLADLADQINSQIASAGISGVIAEVSDSSLKFSSDTGYAFGFTSDDSNILAALGINSFFTGHNAGSAGINPMLDERSFIAAGRIDGDDYYEGDNSNALELVEIKRRDVKLLRWNCDRIDGNSSEEVEESIGGYYNSFLGEMGTIVSAIYDDKEYYGQLFESMKRVRESVSGVSIDEEMANLISFQQAYAAAARIIRAADEMMDELLSMR